MLCLGFVASAGTPGRAEEPGASGGLVINDQEYLEMPGLKLTVWQAQRLWGVDQPTCEAVIERLTEARFLARTRDGAVVLRASTSV